MNRNKSGSGSEIELRFSGSDVLSFLGIGEANGKLVSTN